MATSPEDPSHSQLRDFLRSEHRFYTADRKATAARLGEVTFIAIAGPAWAGKSTLMRRTTELDEDIHLYQSSTTRPRQDGDEENYRTDVPIEEFVRAVKERSLINYHVHSDGHIYGTFADGFQAPATIGAVDLADSFEHLDAASFRDVRTVYTVMTGETYATRLGLDRITRTEDPDATKQALEESIESLEFAADNIGYEWLTPLQLSNEPGALDRAARNLARIAHERSVETPSIDHSRKLLNEMAAVAMAALERLAER